MIILLLIILFFIFYIILNFIINKFIVLNILHNHLIEVIWTIIPIIVLLLLAIPSLKILYVFDELLLTNITIKVLGHQWYWRYEYRDFLNINLRFDSYIVGGEFIEINMFRLLDVDNRLILPRGVLIRNLVSSIDVIHSWTVPRLGVKVDAIPGRINQIGMLIDRSGLYYGQCSEICGLNHRFIPIVLEVISLNKFFIWVQKNILLNILN